MPRGWAIGAAGTAGAAAGAGTAFVPVADWGPGVVYVGTGVANGDAAGVAEPVAAGAAALGSSGIGFSEGVGVADGVGVRFGGCVGWAWRPACGCVGIMYPLWGVIGCW